MNSVRFAVRRVARESLDAMVPGWQQETTEDLPTRGVNLIYDERDPKRFYLYPVVPTGSTASADIIYSTAPDDATLNGGITLDDIYADALLDYILYRAFSKEEEEVPIDSTKAAFHGAAFYNAIGQRFEARRLLAEQGGAN